MARAYYNEIDPSAAQWLRNLIAAGHIAPGDVDERSIEDVLPTDLMGYTQCHFFAGIGIWSYSLRQAGWPDDRPVWTGSCPCQPFSTAGKGAGVADERHLWPAWFHLLEHGKAAGIPVFGEQVANGDGLTWLDLVQADMEGAGYAFRAVDLCAAGWGAPHIRQRLFFHADRLADPGHSERGGRDTLRDAEGEHGREAGTGEGAGAERERPVDDASVRGPGCWLADACKGERGWRTSDGDGECDGPEGGRHEDPGNPSGRGEVRGMADAAGARELGGETSNSDKAVARALGPHSNDLRDFVHMAGGQPGPVNGRWATSDWLWCRDQKWRPVRPGTFPLVDGASARVVRLRAYGNGIVSETATGFIKACMTP